MKNKSKSQPEGDLLTIDEFCARHRLSRQFFYSRLDEMPCSFKIGARRYITREAAAKWRAERDATAEA